MREILVFATLPRQDGDEAKKRTRKILADLLVSMMDISGIFAVSVSPQQDALIVYVTDADLERILQEIRSTPGVADVEVIPH